MLDREVANLSGGELQRFIIAITCLQRADVYLFDEPSSYLDVKQRLRAGRMIRSLLSPDTYVVCVEHDLSILDYLSDYICCLYGTPGAYGVVTMPSGVREGINIFLAGFVPSENMRFRTEELSFKVTEAGGGEDEKKTEEEEDEKKPKKSHAMIYSYPKLQKSFGTFSLDVMSGEFSHSEIVVLLGENGTGKSTLIHMLAGVEKPDDSEIEVSMIA